MKTFVGLENRDGWYFVSKEDVIEAIYDNSIAYFDADTVEEFERTFGVSVFDFADSPVSYDEVEDFVSDRKKYPSQVAQGCYCEDVYSKDELESIVDAGGVLFWDNLEYPTDVADFDFNQYYVYWDGSNWRCILVEWLIEVEAERVDYELGDTFQRNFYETEDGKKFSVYVSRYQGSIPEVEEDFGDWDKILEEAL